METNKTKRTERNDKEPYITGLYDKPAIEEAEAGVPLSLEPCPDDAEGATLIDKEHYGNIYNVNDGGAYTIRLGVHSNPIGIGVMDKDTAVVCGIPTTTDDVHRILALFFIPELHPVKYMDAIWLRAEKPFHIEYVWGSAVLESNHESRELALRHDAVTKDEDTLVILQNGLDGEIPDSCTFSYDFIKFQIRIVCDE